MYRLTGTGTVIVIIYSTATVLERQYWATVLHQYWLAATDLSLMA